METIQALLRKVASRVLNKVESEITAEKSFTEQGGNALSAVFFAAQCRDAGLPVDVTEVSQPKSLSELAQKLLQTHPHLQSEETAGHQDEFLPFTELQKLYNTTKSSDIFIWHVETPISHQEATDLLEHVVQRHPVLGASIEDNDKRSGLVLGTSSTLAETLVPYENDEKCTSHLEKLQHGTTSKTNVLDVVCFGGTSNVRRIGLKIPTAALDAHSWHLLQQDLPMFSHRTAHQGPQKFTFAVWLDKFKQGKTGSCTTLLNPVKSRYPSAQPNQSPTSLVTATLSSQLTKDVLEGSYYERLRTEISDLLLASVASAFDEGEPASAVRYLELRDGRPSEDGSAWDTVIGCFDELLEIPYQHSTDAIGAVRRAKDGLRSSSIAALDRSSPQRYVILDTTRLRGHASSLRLHEDLPRKGAAMALVAALGGTYVLPHLAGTRLSFSIVSSEDEASVRRRSEKLTLHLANIITALKDCQSLPTLSDFPHISLDYPSLDRLYEQKLQHIANEPLSEIQGIYPCSPIQENILVSNSLQKGSYICRFTVSISTSGLFASCDADRWVTAWSKVVEKHSSLRTVFVESEDRPGHFYQVVLHRVKPRVSIMKGIKTPSDVSFSPLEAPHHLTICQAGPGRFQLVLTISHTITDGHSTEVILSDVCGYVAGLGGGKEKVLNYTDYVLDQYQSPDTPVSDYWPKYLLKTQETFLPVTREKADLYDFETANSVMNINVASIDRLCQQHNINLSSVCQFAWGAVLRCHLGVDNVCFSYIAAVRHIPLKGIMTAVGPLITTLLCSMNLSGDASILDVIKAFNDDYQASLPHETEVSEAMSTRRWSNTVMSFRRRLAQDEDSLPGLKVKMIQGLSPTNYDVSLIVSAGKTDMEFSLDYWASRMDHDYAEGLLRTFEQVLYSIFRDIGTTVDRLEMISPEQKQLLLDRNSHVPRGLNKCIHELIDEALKDRSDSLAIEAWDGNMTCGELDEEASRLAQHLIDAGVRPDVPVGVCMEKSKHVPVAILAILRAGGAVLPIGRAEPLARVKAILADSCPIGVICDDTHADRLAGVGARILSMSSLMERNLRFSLIKADVSQRRVTPSNMAWIIYTSGSTGTPKGVVLEHNALATSMQSHGATFGLSRHTRTLQFAAHTFDVSLHELCTTLIYGGCICIPSELERVNDLAACIRRLRVNLLPLTPSVASTLTPEDVPLVQKLIVFGEEVKASVVETWLGKVSIINAYGPTECSIFAGVSHPFRKVDDFPNIGFPMSGNFWVTDPQNPGRLVPPGAPGELLVEGPLLARGYLNDREKTDAAFIQDPEFAWRVLGLEKGKRLYRTGDIVRQNSDFSMNYVGRRDTQIKVRGQRLDVAEVEHWITKLHEGLPRAVVGLLPAARDDQVSSGPSLFAAVEIGDSTGLVPPGDQVILPASDGVRGALGRLRSALQAELPTHMIPVFYVPFRKIPLTTSTKTDRKMVRQLVGDLSQDDLQVYVAVDIGGDEVLTETGRKLQGLWATVLGVSSTSIRAGDHFLYRGGDSVSAIKLVEAARREDMHLTVLDVLSFPRLEELARVLDKRQDSSLGAGEPRDPAPFSLWQASSNDRKEEMSDIASQCNLSVEDIEDIYPCTPLQQGMLAATQQRHTAYLVRQVYSLSEAVNIDRFRDAWQVLIEKAPLMRTQMLPGHRSGPLQILSKSPPAWYSRDSLDKYVAEDQDRPMTVGQPLMRFALIHEASNGARYFVWTAHHSVYDGWSAKLIYRQLVGLYLHNKVPPVIPFTRFIAHLQDEELRGQQAASFWRRQLEGEAPAAFPSLPSSFYQPHPVSALRSSIDTSASTAGLSLANVLRAAWAMTLSQYLGTRDVVFGATLSGRNANVAEITELIAPTFTTVPIRVHVDQSKTVGEYLNEIQSQAVEMIAFEHTGLKEIRRLVPDLEPATDIKHDLIIEPPPTAVEEDLTIKIPGMKLVNTAVNAFDTFSLTLQCQLPRTQGGLIQVEARYDDQVVTEPQVAVLLQQLGHWMSLIMDETNRDSALQGLEGVTPADLAQIRQHNLEAPVSDDVCLHHMVQRVVYEQPDLPAICAWDGSFTYDELWSQARKLAKHLSELGVASAVRVGLCMDKSRWTVVSMLGILEAGGTVVLMGTQYSTSHLQVLMKDCQARLVLTNADHTHRLAGSGPSIIHVDGKLLDTLAPPTGEGPICLELKPHHPAWIVYSSGSTGAPKGSLLIHAGLSTSLPAHGRATNWSNKNRVLQFSAHTFDVCIQEIITTLLFGGCVCIPSEDQRLNSLAQAITDLNANSIVLTSTVASTISPAEVPCVTQLQLVGEQAKPTVVERWLDHVEIINIYGPSECSVYSSCSKPMRTIADAPNVGLPLDHCNLWIASTADYNRLCPIGVPGELLIENAWQAQEYINNPELTARSFIKEPGFIKKLGLGGTGRRMYRSGDLVRQNPDGTYTHLGRIDSQVKFRGHRVDLSQIEYWISKLLPGVRTAVVDLVDLQAGNGAGDLVTVMDFAEDSEVAESAEIEDIDGVKILAPSVDLSKALRALKDALADKLPSYMVPTSYLPWHKIPLNPSGKTNRAAVRKFLTGPQSELALYQRYLADDGTKEAPKTDTGRLLQRLWAEVLSMDIDSIGGEDHFTRLGGDSLAAIKLVAAGRQVGLHTTVSSIFKHPVLDEFAKFLDEEQEVAGSTISDPLPFELSEFGNAASPGFDLQLAHVAAQCQVAPEQVLDVYPCLPMQEALFAITARQPTTYTNRQVFKAAENFDMVKFQAAWETVTAALPILRTRIVLHGASGFLQAVIDAPMVWHQGKDLDNYLRKDKAAGFEAGQPLFRCAIVGNHFILTTHHSMFDRWSLQRLYRHYLYPAYTGHELPAVVPYPRFLRYVQDTDLDAASAYWNQMLADGDTFTDFPPLPPSSYYQTKATSLIKRTVGVDSAVKLQIPFPSLLRAAWALTVAQYAAVEDVMFAVNLSGRSAPVADIADLAAPTFTTVPVRIQVSSGQKVQDYLQSVHDQAVEMIPYEHVGFQTIKKLVPAFAPSDLRHLFLVHPAAEAGMDDPSLLADGFEQVQMNMEVQDEYPLTLTCKVNAERGSQAVIEAGFDGSIIPKRRLISILQQFEHNVTQLGNTASAAEGQNVGSLQLTNKHDLEQISKWNDVTHQDIYLGCVHELVRKTVRTSPGDEAVCSWDGTFTYQQLDQKARILAQFLVTEANVGPEVVVGFCMDKSRWTVVAMLAILYAGGVVVPIGVQLPLERMSTIVKDCSPAMILCDQDHVQNFKSLGCKSVVVDGETLNIVERTNKNDNQGVPSTVVSPSNAAWIMYTSGSTGTPKGVIVEHRGLCSAVYGMGSAYKVDATYRVLQFSAYTWDVAISDTFFTLAAGATLCIPSESERMNDLVGAIQRLRVNFMNLTPSTAALIDPSDVPLIHTMALGGEHINPALVDKWSRFSNATLMNSYGPVECSITSTTNAMLADKKDSADIGTALAGTYTWVVDPHDHNRLAPVGAVGELVLEGPHVGRGYLHDPVKTAKSFITDPGFVAEVGPKGRPRRMYLTGDLAKYTKDGSLIILGRGDSQVKIRGQRVELAEIEFWIVELVPEVRTAVVEYLGPNAEQRALIAAVEFYNQDDNSNVESVSARLKKALVEKLPSYMIPRLYLQMERMPVSPSGKTDRRAVRRFMLDQATSRMDKPLADVMEHGEVHGDEERAMRKLWATVLGLEEDSIDRQNNFFDLGADSISAMKLVALVRMEGQSLQVVEVFRNPVLSQLAVVARTSNGSAVYQQNYIPFQLLNGVEDVDTFLEEVACPATETSKEDIEDVYPAMDAAAFNVIGALTSSQTEVNTFALDTASDLDVKRLEVSCGMLAQHVEAFRTAFVPNPQDGKLLQVVLKSWEHNIRVIQVNGSMQAATERCLDHDMREPFQLGRPMIQMAILHQKNSNETRIVLRMSHAIYDALSFPVILQTLRELYSQNTVSTQLSPFSSYLHSLRSHTSEESYHYWQELLAGSVVPELSIVTSPLDQVALRMAFTPETTVPVSRLDGRGITTSTIISCAWAHVLAQYTGRDDVVFGEIISGRNLVDPMIADTVVGCCATHVPVRVRFDSAGRSVLESLSQIRDQQRERIPHEGLGFRTMIRDCTDWVSSTRLTSLVNHRPAMQSASTTDGEIKFDFSTVTTETTPLTSWYDLAVISGENEGLVKLSLGYATKAFTQQTAQALLNDLIETMRVIMNSGDSGLEELALFGTDAMPSSSAGLFHSRVAESAAGDHLEHETRPSNMPVNTESSALDRIWCSVFTSAQDMPASDIRHVPFHKLGGDLIDAAHVAALVEKSTKEFLGVRVAKKLYSEVTVDHVLRHPSLEEFAGFLSQRQIELD